MIIKILACIIMTAIAYQDFKYRAIHWLLFPSIIVIFIIDGLLTMSLSQYAYNVTYNILLILVQFTLLYLFYVLRGRNIKLILNKIIGTGDILFILVLSLIFSSHNFLFYYIGGLIFSIVIWFLLRYLSIMKGKLIPFAGLMAIFCIMLLIIELLVPSYDRFNYDVLKIFLNG